MEDIKLFNRWSFEGIVVNDPGLKLYINLKPVIIPKSGGKYTQKQFHKSKMNIVERFANKMMVDGHRGRKHLLTSGRNTGKTQTIFNIIKDVFEEIEKKTKENPLKIFVGAVENASLREEITSYQMGGTMIRKAVITSPQRRVDKALTIITQSSYRRSFGKKISMADALVDEIINAYKNDATKSEAIKEKERIEREAGGAR
ncbi:MAG: 30S ribosomal protein S7 [Candidatus Aenigmarchaeota archaeon CG_4_10_14_0_8_um_filter_37_24]|nr:30S ribosomal protein S7 [Candidatus Aenigmarchaeota archaeon]PIV69353.1 MAG: 30S ribosomal protein S7 [Candidatus Aenigmarchaeota archaeon CG01_land_8_20_14_3_00_37_9]PIW41438.1 MAG: 30S ribosomal protein S7 [Candidatus Aenigmarchaeota archaeon CG15_BIG_FIL_POST_REV_8_21_14_020_37_27]PIX50987.1 MAG: 30S ribosomal protein S7 [Candidatus Aenigmarchaeota archaeon CG_4_8_14_3_um_filter_37_24]PIY34856.1 MAG: 30S ribosomal protein S7 [Candidatus Aenigmarchaeota archaeon CG_4_10_14_3_um_filter_37_